MSDRNKNKRDSLSEFIRYQQGKMSVEERNSFERDLQKDPFAEEAGEGFDHLSAEEISADILILSNRIRSKTKVRRRFAYYSIAASIAVLMVISTLYIVINKSNTTKQISENAGIEKPAKTEEKSLPAVAENQKSAEEPAKSEDKKRKEESMQATLADDSQGAGAAEKAEDAEPPVYDSVPEMKLDNINALVAELQPAAPKASRSRAESPGIFSTAGKITSSEDNMPVPGAIVSVKGTNNSVMTDTGGNFTISLPDSSRHTLVANFIGMESKEFAARADSKTDLKLDPDVTSLSEVVVVGYGAKKADNDDYNTPSGYTPPHPAVGKSAFNRYIEDNIIRPDSLPSGQRVVVVLGILVHTDGSLGEIKIVRSPGNVFSSEAIRLIESGPKWKPAMDEGKVIEDEVKVRIVFR